MPDTMISTTAIDPSIEYGKLYEDQVRLEREMLDIGIESYRKTVEKARTKRQMTNLKPYQRLLDDWLPEVVRGIKDWVKRTPYLGTLPIAFPYIRDAEPELLALISLRMLLDGLAERRHRIIRLAKSIGLQVEHEVLCRSWEKANPAGFRGAQRYFDGEHSTPAHRAQGNIILAGRGEFAWEPWTEEVRFRVGVVLIDILVRHTGFFSVEEDDAVFETRRKSLPLVLVAKPALVDWLAQALDRAEASHPRFLPTLIPPRAWEGTRQGGYWTPYAKTPRLIRFKAHQEQQRERAADEYDALDMPNVYSAVKHLQDVPWKVNRRILEVIEQAWALDMEVGGLPCLSKKDAPPKPADIETNPAANKEWRRQAKGVKRFNNSLVSRMKATHDIVTTAQLFVDRDRIYFPHMLDFRGRAYCIPSGLDPQGRDIARGLLLFAEGKPILEVNNGAFWLAVHLANMMDQDKISLDERVQYVIDNEDAWRAIAGDPVAFRTLSFDDGTDGASFSWSKVKKPWQALAAILEWVAYLDHGEGYRSCLPVVLDGTCNGLQHLTAISRDGDFAPMVNLVPTPRPSDIYQTTAAAWEEDLRTIVASGGEDGMKAAAFLRWAGADEPADNPHGKAGIARAATKRQVMVVPYGGTREAFFTYTKKWLDEHDGFDYDKATRQEKDFRLAVLSLATGRLWAIARRMLPKAMAVMRWLQDCARQCAEANQPIYWTAPKSGFVVRHFYGMQKAKNIKVRLDGTLYQLKAWETTKDLDVKAQTQGIAPNFIHSLDAAALAVTVNTAADYGISLTAIHDAYGTHAADMGHLSYILREAFIQVHAGDVLEEFWGCCREVLVASFMARGMNEGQALKLAAERKPALPEKGDLNLQAIHGSRYFFS